MCRLQPNIAQPTSLQSPDSATSLPSPLLLCCVEVISGAKCAKAPAQPQSTQGLAEPPGIILSEFSGKSITSPCSSPKPRKKNESSCLSCLQPFLAGPGGNKAGWGGSPYRWRASWESSPDPWPLIEAMHPREHWTHMKHLGPQSQNNARRHYKHQTRATQGPQIKHIQCVRSHSQWLPVVLSLSLRLCGTQNILTGTPPRTRSHPRGG